MEFLFNFEFKMKKAPQSLAELDQLNIVFYDGTCVLCNRAAQILMKADKKKQLHYALLQSEKVKMYLTSKGQDISNMNTFVYSAKGKVYIKSRAALEVFQKSVWWGKLAYLFVLVPPFIRNGIYMLVSRNRYKWFGRSEECIIPDKDLKQRLILS
jgi:predicted DCC family thiol-disulfide oxidoreductase YuxK